MAHSGVAPCADAFTTVPGSGGRAAERQADAETLRISWNHRAVLLRTTQADSGAEDYAEDSMRLSEGTAIDLVRAEQVADYKLRLSFSDGVERVIDCEPFLRRSRNPMIRAYLDPQKFANFTLE